MSFVYFHHGAATDGDLATHANAIGLTPTPDAHHSQLKYIVYPDTGSSPIHIPAHTSAALAVSQTEFLALAHTPAASNASKRSFALLDLNLDLSAPPPSSASAASTNPTPTSASGPRPAKRLRTENTTVTSTSTKKTTITTTNATNADDSGSDTDDGSDMDQDDADSEPDSDSDSGPIIPSDHTVAFTGTFISGSRKEVTAQAEKLGFKTKPSITSAVTMVVHGENEAETAKLRAAREKGLRVMSEDAWLAEVVSPMKKKTSGKGSVGSPPTSPSAAKPAAVKSSASGATGGVVVFTGTLPSRRTRAQVTAEAAAAGYTVKPSLTKTTNILVHGTGAAADTKAAEARALGIETLTEPEWTLRISSSSPSPAPPVASSSASSAPAASASILANVANVDESDLVRDSSAAEDADTGALTFGGIQPRVILADGESTEVKGSGSKPYKLKRTGDSYYCTCPAWRMQKGAAADCRTCKHLKALLGDEYEAARLGHTGGLGGVPAAAAGARPKRTVPVKTPSTTDARLNMEVLLAQKWTDKVDATGYHASEKLDGMRAYWCATRKKLYTRNHNVVNAPDWFVENFPTNMSLDGELYVGRDMFNSTMSIVRGSAADDRWKNVQYHIFDIPSLEKPFEQRLQAMQDLVEELGIEHIKAVPHVICTGTPHLLTLLATVESKSGEGIMLRKPKSQYVHGRSDTLLKVKTFADGEAVVTGHQLSTSATYYGQLGALECRMASGKQFRVGSGLTAELRDLSKAPPVGTLITYKCQELTKDGVPRFPVFIGVAPPDRSEPSDPVFGGNANAGVGSED